MSHISMQTMLNSDKDEMFVCPYDPVHRISAKRFIRHLIKCRKANPSADMSVCPFNARHVMPKPEIRHHLSRCPDSRMIETEINYERYGEDGDAIKGDTSVPAIETGDVPFGDDEDWDEDLKASSIQNVSSLKTATPVNHRREAIKRMKEEMKKIVNEETRYEIYQRRPNKQPGVTMKHILMQQDVVRVSGKPLLAANFQKPDSDC